MYSAARRPSSWASTWRDPGGAAAQRAAVGGKLCTTRRPGRATNRCRRSRRHLRPEAQPRPDPLRQPTSDGRRFISPPAIFLETHRSSAATPTRSRSPPLSGAARPKGTACTAPSETSSPPAKAAAAPTTSSSHGYRPTRRSSATPFSESFLPAQRTASAPRLELGGRSGPLRARRTFVRVAGARRRRRTRPARDAAGPHRRSGGGGELRSRQALPVLEPDARRTPAPGIPRHPQRAAKYGFPVDVVELDLGASGDTDAATLDLSRDLALAISEYSPGSQVVAAKVLWMSTGLGVRTGHVWPTYRWAICGDCGAFRQHLAELPPCAVCGSEKLAVGKTGTFVIPLFGFVGKRHAKPGESDRHASRARRPTSATIETPRPTSSPSPARRRRRRRNPDQSARTNHHREPRPSRARLPALRVVRLR